MKAFILAGAKGSQLSPFSNTRPTPMIFAGGRTLFDNTVDLLKKSGINDVFVVVCHQKERLIEHIQNQVNNGINLHYLEQRQEGGI
ncbi:uncharacterized protein METZ01_LOCUS457698, partial [marine metagenome]